MSAPAPEARCSVRSLLADEPLAGSAPEATGWVALEQRGPWGAKAFTSSHLDPEVGRAIEGAAGAAGVRPCLIRRPGHHADLAPSTRRVLVAHSVPGRVWLLAGEIGDPAELLALDWAAVAAGDLHAVRRSLPVLEPADENHLLVCTNGTRDVCCAVVGRPVADAAATARPDRVWEVTHTGGHRFAPTAVLLPHGTVHGRLDGFTAIELLAAADRGDTVLAGHRGRSAWPAGGQVAELAVREEAGALGLETVTVAADDGAWRVSHADGRQWRVVVAQEDTGSERPESCAKGAVPMSRYAVRSLTLH